MSPIPQSVFTSAQKFVSPPQKKLLTDIQTISSRLHQDSISDYSFLVSPIAKAYEGFLKDFFLKLGIIDQYNYHSDRFRVGKTLNPSLRYKRFSIFQKLADLDEEGEALAETLWDAWKYGRNEIFHYFPHNLKNITSGEAYERIVQILNAIIKSGEFLKKHRSDLMDPLS
ncbi:MAG: hypothetical protein WC686_03670 [Candidatus Shapirobacteria bacterium]|jgi:hypothetical protein